MRWVVLFLVLALSVGGALAGTPVTYDMGAYEMPPSGGGLAPGLVLTGGNHQPMRRH